MNNENIKVLIIEDDSNVRFTTKSMLEEMGIVDVYEANDGDAALEILNKDMMSINLVLCDWNMPKMSGKDVLNAIRERAPTLPFIMITARADHNSILSAKEGQVSAYIKKPFSFTELQSKVYTILRIKQ